MDRRILKTRSVIKESLTALMKEKPFDKITIKNITDKANINRATFYLHYMDKYDLLEQSQNDILNEIKEVLADAFKIFNPKSLPIQDATTIIPFLSCVYECIAKNSDFVKVILGGNGDLNFHLKFKSLIEELIKKISVIKTPDSFCIPLKYLIETATSMHIGIISRWLEDGMIETPYELACITSSIIVSVSNSVIKN
ncbi:TetR/AcrR family transcriptional regulator [Paraclostridium bifermentans]|uniref:TetR/AcrR family transcriptional regulator n=1 Tax=Paraclostridium bifermentans TaxID=1490 RepID=UPI001C81922D|nr:TetR/AcrR family transcriptional regulator C-terminal domain-containing protein [Paraclostridium bifermentans]GIM33932.1 TetR family transcriptional regulator [Paraclostridium bifermentans subsp. muricolitidis]